MRVLLAPIFAALLLAPAAVAQEPAPTVRVTVNGEAITSDLVEARQYDLVAKDTIVNAVSAEAGTLTHNPSVKQDLKGLLAIVVQENPDATKEQIMESAKQKSVVFVQHMAVRKVRPKLFEAVEAKAIEELVAEQLMLQEAKRQGIAIDDAAVDAVAVSPRAGADGETLHKLLVAWDRRALPSAKARVRARMGWEAALKKRLGAEAESNFDAVSARELASLKHGATITTP